MINRFLNPGGTIELMDIIYPPQSDDGTLSEGSPLYEWSALLLRTFATMGSPLDSALRYKEQLEAAGFVDVKVAKRKWPMNRWPKDPKYKQIGKSTVETQPHTHKHTLKATVYAHTSFAI